MCKNEWLCVDWSMSLIHRIFLLSHAIFILLENGILRTHPGRGKKKKKQKNICNNEHIENVNKRKRAGKKESLYLFCSRHQHRENKNKITKKYRASVMEMIKLNRK